MIFSLESYKLFRQNGLFLTLVLGLGGPQSCKNNLDGSTNTLTRWSLVEGISRRAGVGV